MQNMKEKNEPPHMNLNDFRDGRSYKEALTQKNPTQVQRHESKKK